MTNVTRLTAQLAANGSLDGFGRASEPSTAEVAVYDALGDGPAASEP
jgi:hypothetical protein